MMSWRGLCKGGIQICTSGAQRFAGTYSRFAVQDHYQVLGVGKEASSSDIKNAFFALSKKCHPDSDPSNPRLHAKFVRLNEAYKVLSKQSSRKEYDRILEAIQRNGPAFRDQNPYRSSSSASNTTYTYRKEEKPFGWSTADTDNWYWSQFPPKQEYNESLKERQVRNQMAVFCCIFLVFTSLYLHFFGFRSLRELHEKELQEEQKKIQDFYNKRREDARVNGFSKQQEILLKKHEEKLRKLYGREDEARK